MKMLRRLNALDRPDFAKKKVKIIGDSFYYNL